MKAPLAAQQAWQLFAGGERGEAESLYRSILQQEPEHTGLLAMLAVILAQSGGAEEAAKLFGQAVTRTPDDPAAHIN